MAMNISNIDHSDIGDRTEINQTEKIDYTDTVDLHCGGCNRVFQYLNERQKHVLTCIAPKKGETFSKLLSREVPKKQNRSWTTESESEKILPSSQPIQSSIEEDIAATSNTIEEEIAATPSSIAEQLNVTRKCQPLI